MALHLELTRRGGRPLYRQIAEQIKTRIQDGRLPDGARLPTVRELAQDLDVSALTVHNAYTELQLQGFVESIVGSGTFVSADVSATGLVDSLWRRHSLDSFMNDLQTVMYAPNLRPLATAGADPRLFCTDQFWTSFNRLSREPPTLFLYSPPDGDARLKNEIAGLLDDRGIRCSPDELLVTNGATRALAISTQTLSKPGDRVLVEENTYVGFLAMLETSGVVPIPVPTDENGAIVDEIPKLIRDHKPAFYFSIPNFGNPTGVLMSNSRRERLIEITEETGLYVVEDDVFARLSYDGPPPMPLKSMDRADRVVYVDSFCKSLFPGARIGYLVPPKHLRDDFAAILRSLDLSGTLIMQRALARFLEEGAFRAHLKRVLPKYRDRRDAMIRELKKSMPPEVSWTYPKGGFTLWMSLPNSPKFRDLYSSSLARGVAIAPGELFSGSQNGMMNFRISFGMVAPEEIQEAITVLAQLIRARL